MCGTGVGSLVIILKAPAIALLPYNADPAPFITSIRSTSPVPICSNPYTLARPE